VFVLGVIGFLMRRFDYPLAPVILGIVLGPLIDNNFRRAMIMTDGSLLAIAARPGTAAILVGAVLFFSLPFLLRWYAKASGQKEVAELVETAVG
jgi:putative tricarboxylic transport membrane protein